MTIACLPRAFKICQVTADDANKSTSMNKDPITDLSASCVSVLKLRASTLSRVHSDQHKLERISRREVNLQRHRLSVEQVQPCLGRSWSNSLDA